MTSTITNWPLTLEQFLALPEAEPALEMGCNGEISQKVSPTTRHAVLQRDFAARLEAHAAPRRQGHSFTEQRVVLSRVARVPEDRPELVAKAAWYVEQGVRIVLLVDPDRRRVTAFTAAGEAAYATTEALPLGEVLPGLQLTPAELFTALDPRL